MENETRNTNKKPTSTSKNKTEEKCLTVLGRKEKSNTVETNNTTRVYKPEDTGERRKTE